MPITPSLLARKIHPSPPRYAEVREGGFGAQGRAGWACPACQAWRGSRRRPRSARQPHATDIRNQARASSRRYLYKRREAVEDSVFSVIATVAPTAPDAVRTEELASLCSTRRGGGRKMDGRRARVRAGLGCARVVASRRRIARAGLDLEAVNGVQGQELLRLREVLSVLRAALSPVLLSYERIHS